MDARAFNEWLQNRQLKRQGEEYADAMGRMAETVNRRIPSSGGPARSGGKCSEPRSSWPRASRQNMEEQRAFGFRVRPRFSEVLEYIEEGEPSFGIPLPNRNASIYRSSHFYLDEFPQSTEPLAENPRPHTQLGVAIERLRIRRRWLSRQTFPSTAAPQFSAASARQARRTKLTGEMASIRRGLQIQASPAAVSAGALVRPLQLSLLPAQVEWAKQTRNVIEQAGQRAQEIQEGSRPRHRAVCGGASCRRNGRHHALARRAKQSVGAFGAVVAPEVAIPAAMLLELEEPWSLAWADQRRAHKQRLQVVAGLQPLLAEHLN